VAIVLVGWPWLILSAQSDGPQPKPPAPLLTPDKIAPVVSDDGIEFQAIVDKAPVLPRESAAYGKLLEKVRDTSPQDLSKQARRDIFFTHVWERPEKYRGVPIHLQGTAKKIITYEVSKAMAPSERLYEIWFFSDENKSFPYVVVIQDTPPGLIVGDEIEARVTVDGYFLKLMGYRAGDHLRAAPMLVGRVKFAPAPTAAPSALTELKRLPKREITIGVLILLLLYIAARVFFQVRKVRGMSRPESSLTSMAGEPLPPEQLAEWLHSLPDEPEEQTKDH
jgi:hypothetical protein